MASVTPGILKQIQGSGEERDGPVQDRPAKVLRGEPGREEIRRRIKENRKRKTSHALPARQITGQTSRIR